MGMANRKTCETCRWWSGTFCLNPNSGRLNEQMNYSATCSAWERLYIEHSDEEIID